MSDERILHDIAPPSGGWDRLIARHNRTRPEKGLGLPMAMAASMAIAAFLLRPQSPRELQLPWESARLLAQPSQGLGVQRVGGAEAAPIPSSDPRVRFYWVQPRSAP